MTGAQLLLRFPENEEDEIHLEGNTLELLRKHQPCSIISICGPPKNGKSFIMNWFMLAFDILAKNPDEDFMDWNNVDKGVPTIFPFGNSEENRTRGVWISSNPIVAKEKGFIFFIDCQGIGGEFTTPEQDDAILTTCMLLSTLTIFNTFSQLLEQVLLQSANLLSLNKIPKPTGQLLFLVRDWEDFGYGKESGNTYLQTKLQIDPQHQPEAKVARKILQNLSTTISCVLLPSPGVQAMNQSFNGSLDSLEGDFSRSLEELIEHIFNNLSSISAGELDAAIDRWFQITKKGSLKTSGQKNGYGREEQVASKVNEQKKLDKCSKKECNDDNLAGSQQLLVDPCKTSKSIYGSKPLYFPPQSPAYGEDQTRSSHFEDEPPLLEELGVNPHHIIEKTKAVLDLFRLTTDASILNDADLAGPFAYWVLFGFILLFSGKIYFGCIYGIGVLGCLGMHFILNMMSVPGVSFGVVVSVLGYCLLPIVGLAGINLLLSLQSILGVIVTALAVLWCSLAASKLFVTALNMEHQQPLVAYPCALVYGGFALLAVF